MPRWQPSLEDYIDIAAYLLGVDRVAVARLPRITLAESALHAPFASFGDTEAYPTLIEQAAVLLAHLANNPGDVRRIRRDADADPRRARHRPRASR